MLQQVFAKLWPSSAITRTADTGLTFPKFG